MHSSTIVSSLIALAAVSLAAPAANNGNHYYPGGNNNNAAAAASSSSSTSFDTRYYTPDAPYHPSTSSTAKTTKTTTKATATASSSSAKPTSTGTTGNTDAGFPPVVPANPRANDQSLITSLLTAATQQDRIRLLQQPGDFVFDFNNGPEGSETVGKGGHTVAATAKTFPALISNGVAMTVGFLGPCAMNTPHVHNRATEINIVVEGRLVTNFQVENGLPSMANTLSQYQMSIFPQGAFHQEFNPDCTDAVFVAGFNNADPGVEQVAQTFFGLRPDVVSSSLGGLTSINGADLESFRDLIPANVALGVESCLKKCGIQKNAKRDIAEIFAEAA